MSRVKGDLRSTVHNNSPIHKLKRKITASHRREAKNRHHNKNERTSHNTNRLAEFSQVPWAAAETIADEEYADENGDCEGDVGGDCSHGEDGADGYTTAKN